jgi:hypothetical protein
MGSQYLDRSIVGQQIGHPFANDKTVYRLPGLGVEAENLKLRWKMVAVRLTASIHSFGVRFEEATCRRIHPIELGSCCVNQTETANPFV